MAAPTRDSRVMANRTLVSTSYILALAWRLRSFACAWAASLGEAAGEAPHPKQEQQPAQHQQFPVKPRHADGH